MKKSIILSAIAAIAIAFAIPSFASTTSAPSFNDLQVTAQSADFTSSNPVGWDVSGEKTLGSNFFALGEVDRVYLQKNTTINYRAGLGLKLDLGTPAIAGYTEAYALHLGTVGYNQIHSYGYGADAGVRAQLGNLELSAAINPERAVYNTGWTAYGKVGAQLEITNNIALVVDYKYHSQFDKQWNVGAALNF